MSAQLQQLFAYTASPTLGQINGLDTQPPSNIPGVTLVLRFRAADTVFLPRKAMGPLDFSRRKDLLGVRGRSQACLP